MVHHVAPLVHAVLFIALATTAKAASLNEPPPWTSAGLTAEQAAVHLLDRFAYGPRPGDVERILSMGHEAWFEQQLSPPPETPDLVRRLAPFPDIERSASEIQKRYPPRATAEKMARDAGYLSEADRNDPASHRDGLARFMDDRGLKRPAAFVNQAIAQKMLRAVYSEAQTQERMVDFWFNHFNVSADKTPVRPHIVDYERNAIATHALGSFGALLAATARHPAMLHYLDNALSRSPSKEFRQLRERRGRPIDEERVEYLLNENYARELLELHTLGVDGGYTEVDVRNTARAFTGWTVLAMTPRRRQRDLGQPATFVFQEHLHDQGPKTVMGMTFSGQEGYGEGTAILEHLGTHSSTALHICRKLATFFVSDSPSDRLVANLAAAFVATEGDIRNVLWALYRSPEFWESRHQKVKTPLELVASAFRATGADILDPIPIGRTVERLGQPLYRCSPPTGFPAIGTAWLNAGTAIKRINFGLGFASSRSESFRLPLRKPGSPSTDWTCQLLPGREPENSPVEDTFMLQRTTHRDALETGLILGSEAFQVH